MCTPVCQCPKEENKTKRDANIDNTIDPYWSCGFRGILNGMLST